MSTRIRPAIVCALVVLLHIPLAAADFIRGDVNGDGRVTISDAERFRMWVFEGNPIPCMDAADVNDDGRLDSIDWSRIIYYLEAESIGGTGLSQIGIPPMPAPFPAAGPDLTNDLDPAMDCKSYGGGVPLEDPAAGLNVLDATAIGGDDDRAFITIALTNSVTVGARSGQIRFPDPIVRDFAGWSAGMGFRTRQDGLWFGLADFERAVSVPPGTDSEVLTILVYLKAGVPAGEYPIVLESGELADAATGRAIAPHLTNGKLVVQAAVTGAPGTAHFIRGDINGDGRVTISDIYRFMMWSWDDYFPPQCLDAADVNDDGILNTEDYAYLLRAQYLGGPSILSPFPGTGPDLTDDLDLVTDCKAYGGGEVLEGPTFTLSMVDVTAPGGDDSVAHLKTAFTSSVPIGAISGEIRFLDPIVQTARGVSMPGAMGEGRFIRNIGEGRFKFGVTLSPENAAPPGQDVQAVDISFCLKGNVPAGEYPLVLESAELTDAKTGRAIVPRVTGGSLVIENAVTGVDLFRCDITRPDRPHPEDVRGSFSLGSATAAPGGSFTVPFTIRSDTPAEGFSFSIDFDEEVLQVLSAEFAWKAPAGTKYLTRVLDFSNQSERPGNAGIDEGFIGCALILDQAGEHPVTLPVGEEVTVVNIRFQVKPDADPTTTKIRFLDGACLRGCFRNVLEVLLGGEPYGITPQIANSFVFQEGRVTVIPDVATFVRGDTNGDSVLDLSDAVSSLAFLFIGGRAPACYDAADVNDDGRLDVADPISELGFLYLGGERPPAPYPLPGEDLTPDSIGCLFLR